MLFVLLAILVLACIYAALLFFYLSGWNRLPELQPADGTTRLPSVSVVIAARNEENSILRCLDSLASQDYQEPFEVIVVDDHSTDDTVKQVENFGAIPVELVSLSEYDGEFGKKSALRRGIALASGEVILLTDADCTVPESWITLMTAALGPAKQLATGPVLYAHGRNLLEAFQSLDLLGLMVITGGGWAIGLHHLGNGGNMVVRKTLYREVETDLKGRGLASGDDLFLIQHVARSSSAAIAYVKNPDVVVRSAPETSFRSFIAQRLRWASKNSSLPQRSVQLIWGFVWLTNLAMVTGCVIIFLQPSESAVLVLALSVMIKAIAEFSLLFSAARFAGGQRLLLWFPLAFLINIVYVIAIGALALCTSRFTWKGREVT